MIFTSAFHMMYLCSLYSTSLLVQLDKPDADPRRLYVKRCRPSQSFHLRRHLSNLLSRFVKLPVIIRFKIIFLLNFKPTYLTILPTFVILPYKLFSFTRITLLFLCFHAAFNVKKVLGSNPFCINLNIHLHM